MRCLAEGYWPIVLSSHGERKLEARAMRTLMSLKIAGVLMAPLGFETDAKLLSSLSDSTPAVFLDSRIGDDQPFVGTDNRQSIGNITEYLYRTGEHPCFLEMPAVNQNALERRSAYIETMERLGVEPIVLPITAKNWNFEELGYQEAGRILDRGGFPTRTVLCANDRLAFGVISAAFERRRHVGREEGCDLRVAGHDDHPLSRFTCPPLTTVAQDYRQIAQLGLDMLFSRINAQESAGRQSRRKSVAWTATSSCAALPDISKKTPKRHRSHIFAIPSPQLPGEKMHVVCCFAPFECVNPPLCRHFALITDGAHLS
ncbi:hypothetical protein Q644_18085 [Brucella intermedia 229E]|uniref:Transcriptional regulator LacI/GalR-like sensor domain-containing protein n=1 Tax=Brucella intermedia 229E TaxID=1337887 RepID=U4VBX4_9HYPH|nr:hypothetical protein Q644_18085 [Brucella intermedia 229E]